jgi:hypothetical protein
MAAPIRTSSARTKADEARAFLERAHAKAREIGRRFDELTASLEDDAAHDDGTDRTALRAAVAAILIRPIHGLVLLAGSLGAEHGERARERAAQRDHEHEKRDERSSRRGDQPCRDAK